MGAVSAIVKSARLIPKANANVHQDLVELIFAILFAVMRKEFNKKKS